jgi:dual-specificity kinase
MYRGHVCMVFDKLGLSLYDFLRKNSYRRVPCSRARAACCERGLMVSRRPFSLDLVREFGRQLLEAIECACPCAMMSSCSHGFKMRS